MLLFQPPLCLPLFPQLPLPLLCLLLQVSEVLLAGGGGWVLPNLKTLEEECEGVHVDVNC